MKILRLLVLLPSIILVQYLPVMAQPAGNLKIVIIRHGEKSANGDNLNCQGLNRSLQLVKVLTVKYGKAAGVYVPSLNGGKSTTHARMFQTISPYAIRQDLVINSNYDVGDLSSLANKLQKQNGTQIVVWEHNAMHDLIKALGVKSKGIHWDDNDFDTIWIITYENGKAKLVADKERINPSTICSF